jgi:hypothetical protein
MFSRSRVLPLCLKCSWQHEMSLKLPKRGSYNIKYKLLKSAVITHMFLSFLKYWHLGVEGEEIILVLVSPVQSVTSNHYYCYCCNYYYYTTTATTIVSTTLIVMTLLLDTA